MIQISTPLQLDPHRDMRQLSVLAKLPLVATAPGTQSIKSVLKEHGVDYHFATSADGHDSMATLADADVLIYAASVIAATKNAGADLSPVIPFRPTPILRFLGRPLGGRQNALLQAAVYRLHNTTISSNYNAGGCVVPTFDTLISRIDYAEGTRRISSITVGDWFVDQVRLNRILKLDPASLKLRGLERRVYGWARAHVNRIAAEPWAIPLNYAWFKSGGQHQPQSPDGFRKFRHAIRLLVARNALPGFQLELIGQARTQTLQISRKSFVESPDDPLRSIVIERQPEPLFGSEIPSIVIPAL